MVIGSALGQTRRMAEGATQYRSYAQQSGHYFDRPHAAPPTAPVGGPAAWRGSDMAGDPGWLETLAPEHVDELATAARRIVGAGVRLEDVTAADFPLAGMAAVIDGWRSELVGGRGFVVVRGLPVNEWDRPTIDAAYWLLGHHLGVPGAQNPQGDLLGHVHDTGEEATNPAIRRYRTSGNIDFHCDAADVVGLLCLRPAKAGGQSRIASSVTVFDEARARCPDLVDRLFEPFPLDLRDEHLPGASPVVPVRACAFDGSTLRTFWHSEYYRSAPRHDEVPDYTEDEQALLDLYDGIAEEAGVFLDMWLEPGDMQFLSNHSVIHARTAYEDHPEADRKRHLLRLWLSLTAGGAS